MMGAVHMQITTIGLDIAKNVFQVHGIDGNETVVVRKQLRRGKLIAFFESLAPCLVGIEACATAHHWARELTRDDIDAKRSRPSIGKPRKTYAQKERVNLIGNDQRITSGPAVKRPHSKAEYMTAPEHVRLNTAFLGKTRLLAPFSLFYSVADERPAITLLRLRRDERASISRIPDGNALDAQRTCRATVSCNPRRGSTRSLSARLTGSGSANFVAI